MRPNPAAAAVVLHAPSPLTAAFRLKPASPSVPDPARRHQSRSAEASTATHGPRPVDTAYNWLMPLIVAYCMKSAPPPAPGRAYRSPPPISVCQRLRPTPGRHLLPTASPADAARRRLCLAGSRGQPPTLLLRSMVILYGSVLA